MENYIKINERERDAFVIENESDFHYGSFIRRIVSALIDGMVVLAINNIVGFFYGFWNGLIGREFGLTEVLLLSGINFVIYVAWLQASSWQATLGQKCMHLKVTSMNGKRITILHALGRTAVQFFTLLTAGLGMLPVLFTRKKQALHDLIASTLVLRR